MKFNSTGDSLVVQWLGLGAFTAGAWVQSLVREQRSCKPHNVAKKKKSTEKSHDLDGSKHIFLTSLHICDIDNTVISMDFLEDVMIFFFLGLCLTYGKDPQPKLF